MPAILITGGTGLIGTALTKEFLKRNYNVIILTRSPEKYSSTAEVEYAKWNIGSQEIDTDAVGKADYIVHLAGENLAAKRWTSKRKKEILESRTKGSDLIVRSLATNANKIRAVISASAIGWYGESIDTRGTGNKPFIESDPPAEDFLGTTCHAWERAIDPVATLGKRLVKLRTGLVLSNEEGILREFQKPLKFGIASILGSGRQIMSWIHIDDLARLYCHAIEQQDLQGVYNAVAPFPVTNKNFVLVLARMEKGKFFVPVYVPSFALKVMLGEMSVEVLKSACVSCEKTKRTGFTFLHPSIDSAIRELVVP